MEFIKFKRLLFCTEYFHTLLHYNSDNLPALIVDGDDGTEDNVSTVVGSETFVQYTIM